MSILPMVERELRERARLRSTYWVRGVAAFLATSVAGFVLMFVTATTLGTVGKVTLNILAWLAFPFVILEGLRNTADSLSAEKREGTLGLLFLTDLKGHDVVLGKFFASSLSSVYALLAIVPALAVPVLLGGVTGAEFWRLVLSLLNALFFSLTAGTLVSCLSREERRAWTATVALLAMFVLVVPMLSSALNLPRLATLSPSTAFWLYDEARYTAAPANYWNALWIPHVLSWAFLVLASILLPHVWQESGSRGTRRRVARNPGTAQERNRVLAINPIWWLTTRQTQQRAWLWSICGAASVAGIAAWAVAANDPGTLWILFLSALALHLVLAIWLAFEACNSFSDARTSGAMELILSTPLTVREILRGQHLALRHLFLGPIALLLAVELMLVAGQIWRMTQSGASAFERIILVLMLGFCLVWFVLDLFAVAEVGMWYGLTSRKPTQALTRTVLFVLILPLLVLPCCSAVGPGLMVAKSVIFFTWAQGRLETRFRRAAAERFEAPTTRGWFRREQRKLRMPGSP